MTENDLGMILKAEKVALKRIEGAHENSKKIMRQAREESLRYRERMLDDFEDMKARRLKETLERAREDARKIVEEGETQTHELMLKAQGRISLAVDEVIGFIETTMHGP